MENKSKDKNLLKYMLQFKYVQTLAAVEILIVVGLILTYFISNYYRSGASFQTTQNIIIITTVIYLVLCFSGLFVGMKISKYAKEKLGIEVK